MRTFLVVLRRELAGWYLAPAHYATLAVFTALTGLSIWVSAMRSAGRNLQPSELVFGSVLFWLTALSATVFSAVRPYGEERENGTLELLRSTAVADGAVLLAKFCGTLVWLGILFTPALAAVPVMHALGIASGPLDLLGLAAAGLLFGLVVAFFAAAALLASLLARRQIVAAALAFAGGSVVLLLARFHEVLFQTPSAPWEPVVSARHPLLAVVRGEVDVRFVVTFAAGTAWLLFAALKAIEWTRVRGLGRRMDRLLAVVLSGALAAIVATVAWRHPAQWDLHALAGGGGLSERTVRILQRLDGPVHLTVICPSGTALGNAVARLLQRFREASPYVAVEFVDPERDLVRTKELATRFRLSRANVMIVDAGASADCLDLVHEGAPAPPGNTATSTAAVIGEGEIAAGIDRVTEAQRPLVCFLRGHGERDIRDFTGPRGYGEIARRIAQENMDVEPVSSGGSLTLSNRCAVLVVAGPAFPLTRPEVTSLAEYLQNGGRALFLLDAGAETGLEDLLQQWNLRLGADRVVEPRPRGIPLAGLRKLGDVSGSGELLVGQLGDHPLTRNLEGLVLTFYMPRSVWPIAAPEKKAGVPDKREDKPVVTVLASSAADGWAETDFDEQPPRFDAGYDVAGPVPVAACVERGAGGAIDVELKPTRIVVIGDADFVANAYLTGANGEFCIRALHWLAAQEHLMAPGPERQGVTFKVGGRDFLMMFAFLVLAVPLGGLALGGLVFVARRDRRS